MPGADETIRVVQAGVSRLWMDEDGILCGEPVPGGESTGQSVKEVMAAIDAITGGSRPRLLYDMRAIGFVQADARRLAMREFHRFVSAAAIVVDEGVSAMLMDFFAGVDEGEIPIRMFTGMNEARSWLQSLDGAVDPDDAGG